MALYRLGYCRNKYFFSRRVVDFIYFNRRSFIDWFYRKLQYSNMKMVEYNFFLQNKTCIESKDRFNCLRDNTFDRFFSTFSYWYCSYRWLHKLFSEQISMDIVVLSKSMRILCWNESRTLKYDINLFFYTNFRRQKKKVYRINTWNNLHSWCSSRRRNMNRNRYQLPNKNLCDLRRSEMLLITWLFLVYLPWRNHGCLSHLQFFDNKRKINLSLMLILEQSRMLILLTILLCACW